MDIMNAIWDIEQKARQIASSAEELEKNQAEVLRGEIKEKEDKMAERLKTAREAIEREGFLRREEAMEKLEKSYAQKLESLDEKCRQNKEKWVSEIVAGIVEVQ